MRESRRGEIALFAAALALRIAWAADLSRLPFFDLPTGDSLFYARRAAEIAGGGWIGRELSYPSSPLYPYLIAPFLVVGGRAAFWGIYLFQALLDASSAVLLRRTGKALFGARAGWIAGTAWAFYGLSVFYSADVMEATAAAFLANLFFCLLVTRRAEPSRGGHALGAGAALAAAALLRPHFLPLLPVALLASCALAPRGLRLRSAGAFAAGAGVLLGLSLARNVAASGEVVLVSPYSGLNAYLGNRRGAPGILAFPSGRGLRNDVDLREAAHAYPESVEGRRMSETEVSRFWWLETRREIAADPAAWAVLMARKLKLFWDSYEIPNHLDFEYFRGDSLPLAIAFVPFGLLAPLALLGMALVVTSPRDPRHVALVLLTLAYGASCSLFFIADRFRLPVCGWIALLAGFALDRILARAASGRWPAAIVAAGATIVLAFVLHVPPPPVHGTREHVMVAAALSGRGRIADAERLLRSAIDTDPGSAIAHFNLGRLLGSQGRAAEAEGEIGEAARLAPGFPAAQAALADLARSRGTPEGEAEARRRWEAALAIEPYGREADRIREALRSAGAEDPSPGDRR